MGAVSVHGLWGALAVGLLADGSYGEGWNGVPGRVTGLLFGDARQLAAQALGVGSDLVFVFGAAFGLFKLVDRVMGNRVSGEAEWAGLDVSEMGSEAYPPG